MCRVYKIDINFHLKGILNLKRQGGRKLQENLLHILFQRTVIQEGGQ